MGDLKVTHGSPSSAELWDACMEVMALEGQRPLELQRVVDATGLESATIISMLVRETGVRKLAAVTFRYPPLPTPAIIRMEEQKEIKMDTEQVRQSDAKRRLKFARDIMEAIEAIPGVLSAKLDDWTTDADNLSGFVELKWQGSPDMFGIRDRVSRIYLEGETPGKRRSQMSRIVRQIHKTLTIVSAASPSFSASAEVQCPTQQYKTIDDKKQFQFYTGSAIRLDIKIAG